jgi:type 1 glutamine amidotransferase
MPEGSKFARSAIVRAAIILFISALLLPAVVSANIQRPARIVLVAGTPSHGPGDHEFNAGVKILAECLKMVDGVEPVTVHGGWPADEEVFKGAAAIVLYMDGGDHHPMTRGRRMDLIGGLLAKGVGLACLHYAVEFPKGAIGEKVLDWLGGYYETGYSTNPHNDVLLSPNPSHPISRGVSPFQLLDEWYYRIRFRPDDKRITPVLTAMLPKDKPARETVAWAAERSDGGRSFGFTGGHIHKNWGHDGFRKLVLNAILWIAKREVPANGVESRVSPEQLRANLDPK